MKDLQKGKPFVEVMEEFLSWCGEDYIFCTWGPLDLFELQRNMHYYGMEPLGSEPIRFLDIQKLFSIAYEDKKARRSLEYATDYLNIKKDIPFHRAFGDAYYTAEILACIEDGVLENYSIDTYILPKSRKEEIHVLFSDYVKYISREFEDKQKALEDREVISTKCYLCHKNIRKKIRWFSPNGRNYVCLAYCEKHGYLKGKIRIRKSPAGRVYVVKTTKLISPEDAQALKMRKKHVSDLHRDRDGRKKGKISKK